MIPCLLALAVLIAASVFALLGAIGLGAWLAVGAACLIFGFWWAHTWDERDSARVLRRSRRPE